MKTRMLLAVFLLAVGLCLVLGVGYGEDIPPEVLEVVPDRVWEMIGEAKKKEAEPSKLRELIDELKEGGVDIIGMTETNLLRSRLNYIMWNPHDFLCFYWEWDWIGLFHLNHELPENIIGKTEGKLVIQVYDTRRVFVYISEAVLLEQFRKELVRIWYFTPRGLFSRMDKDVVALFYDYEGTPLGYFYQGEYYSWEK